MPKKSQDALDALLDSASKKYNLSVGPLGSIAQETKFISTGNIAINYAMGGGIPLGRSIEVFGPPSSGKAQRWTDVVHTPDRGFVQIKDLKIGDRVSSPSGSDSVIEGIYPQGPLQMVKFTFSDGTSAVSSEDHLWNVVSMNKVFGMKPNTVTASEIIKAMSRKAHRVRDIHLPAHLPVEMDEADLPIHPYVLGALIGDGSFREGTPNITSADPQIVDRCDAEMVPGVHRTFKSKRGIATTWAYSKDDTRGGVTNPLTQRLRDLGLWDHKSELKFIPEMYFNSSLQQRIDLMQGLMDTDGEGRGPGGGGEDTDAVFFYTSSPQLAQDVARLARSLGTVAFIRDRIPNYVHLAEKREGLPAYTVSMRNMSKRYGFEMFHLDRKKPDCLYEMRNRNRQFKSFEYLDIEDAVCIKVSSPDSLYFTNDFIPTHNTTLALQGAAVLQGIIRSGGDESRGIAPTDKILYLDYESAMDPEYAKALGLDLDHESLLFTQPDTLEDGANFVLQALETGRIRLVIFDSVAAMNPSAKAEAEIGKSLPAVQAKLMKDFGVNLNTALHNNNASAIFINHEMEKMQMGGRPGMAPQTTTPGGVALKYFASVRVSFKQIKQNKEGYTDPVTKETVERVTSTDVKVKVVKNKVAPPFREAIVRVRFGEGFDNFWTAIQILLAQKKIIHNGGMYYFHNIEDEGLAPGWMARATTGTQRPYIKGVSALFKMAKKHQDWRSGIIDLATQLVGESIKASEVEDDEIEDDEEESEDLDIDSILD